VFHLSCVCLSVIGDDNFTKKRLLPYSLDPVFFSDRQLLSPSLFLLVIHASVSRSIALLFTMLIRSIEHAPSLMCGAIVFPLDVQIMMAAGLFLFALG